MARMEIILKKDGSISAEGFDFKGPECMEARKFLDELFDSPEFSENKLEYFDKVTDQNLVTNGWCG